MPTFGAVIEVPHDTTRAVTSLLLTRSFTRYPDIKWLFSHAGGTIPMMAGRIAGAMFLTHVSVKLTAGPGAVAASVLAKNGLEPAILWAYVIIFLELVGGICLIIGLFTRFFAAALAIEMLIALLLVHLPKGYAASGGGYEYVLLIGAVCFLFAIRGGGPYSFDRIIGREL